MVDLSRPPRVVPVQAAAVLEGRDEPPRVRWRLDFV
jgi:hypothetical protein